MFVEDINTNYVTVYAFVEFPIKPICATYAESLQDYLYDKVVAERNEGAESVLLGDFLTGHGESVDRITYQFGNLYNIEHDCDDVKELLMQHAEEWLDRMGGYEKVRAD